MSDNPSCNLYFHETVEESKKMGFFSTALSLYEALEVPQGSVDLPPPLPNRAALIPSLVSSQETPHKRAKPHIIQSVASLPIGSALSLMAFYATYTEGLSRAHIVPLELERSTGDALLECWRDAGLLVGQEVWGPFGVPRSAVHGRRVANHAVCSGVYVHRVSETHYHIGLLTHSVPHCSTTQALVESFSTVLGVAPSVLLVRPVPLAAGRRDCRLSLWWCPSGRRVVPYDALPPVKVILHQYDQTTSTATTEVDKNNFFSAYEAVRLFLCRPVNSVLLGRCVLPLSLVLSAPISSRKSERLAVPVNPDPYYSNTDTEESTVNATHVYYEEAAEAAHDRDGRLVDWTTHFFLSEISVSNVGEHLIGVEVEVKEDFQPFVPSLCGHLKPFLVVSPDE